MYGAGWTCGLIMGDDDMFKVSSTVCGVCASSLDHIISLAVESYVLGKKVFLGRDIYKILLEKYPNVMSGLDADESNMVPPMSAYICTEDGKKGVLISCSIKEND